MLVQQIPTGMSTRMDKPLLAPAAQVQTIKDKQKKKKKKKKKERKKERKISNSKGIVRQIIEICGF